MFIKRHVYISAIPPIIGIVSTINPNAKHPDLEFLNLKSGNNIIIPQHPLGDFF